MAGRLQKSNRNRILFGVAGGLAEHFHVDPVIFRVAFILLAFASGIGVFIYLILALLLPRPEAVVTEPLAVVKDNLKAAPREAAVAGRRVVDVLRGPVEARPPERIESGEQPGDGAHLP